MAKNLHSNSRTAWMLVALTILMSAGVVALLHFGSSTADGRILFTQFDGTDYEIYAMDSAGNVEQLTNNDVDDWGAGWSPDYTQIAFRSTRNGLSSIYVMDADGMNVQAVTPARLHTGEFGRAGIPSWSSDGSLITFEALDLTRQVPNYDIYVINLDNDNVEQITQDIDNNWHPDFSPNGSQIAYASEAFGEDCYYSCDIFVINRNGTNPRQYTHSYGMDVFPQWSPDGSQIMFHSERTGNSDIFIMNADGTRQSNITNSEALDRTGRWSADGDSILFRSDRDGDSDIFVMNLGNGDITPMTDNAVTDIYPDW